MSDRVTLPRATSSLAASLRTRARSVVNIFVSSGSTISTVLAGGGTSAGLSIFAQKTVSSGGPAISTTVSSGGNRSICPKGSLGAKAEDEVVQDATSTAAIRTCCLPGRARKAVAAAAIAANTQADRKM
jgi:hypothetical protein